LLDNQNNDVRRSNWLLECQNLFAASLCLNVPHSDKKVIPATRNLRTNSASTMYYKVVITTMNK